MENSQASIWMLECANAYEVGKSVADVSNGPYVAYCALGMTLKMRGYAASLKLMHNRTNTEVVYRHGLQKDELFFKLEASFGKDKGADAAMAEFADKSAGFLPDKEALPLISEVGRNFSEFAKGYGRELCSFTWRSNSPVRAESDLHIDATSEAVAIAYITKHKTSLHAKPGTYQLEDIQPLAGRPYPPSGYLKLTPEIKKNLGCTPNFTFAAWRGPRDARPSPHQRGAVNSGTRVICVGAIERR